MPPTPSESSALLPNGGSRRNFSESDTAANGSLIHRTSAFFKAEGEPSYYDSFRHFIFGSWINILLVFVPLSAISHNLDWDAALRFSFSFFAIVPLAAVGPRSAGIVAPRLMFIPVVHSFWARPPIRCQQSWAKRLLDCSTRRSETLLKSLSELPPCFKVSEDSSCLSV